MPVVVIVINHMTISIVIGKWNLVLEVHTGQVFQHSISMISRGQLSETSIRRHELHCKPCIFHTKNVVGHIVYFTL